MKAPLAGIRVLELATVLAGPYVGQTLAELGATVTKVEPPQGDVTRSWKRPEEDPDEDRSAYFDAVNAGKQIYRLDLTKPNAQASVQAWLQNTDLLVTNLKPSALAKFSLGLSLLRERFPRLIIASLTGYGPDHPGIGYDALVQAESGFQHLNGEPGGEPTKLPVALMDVLAAQQLLTGILAALYSRERTNQGALIELGLFQAGVAGLANQLSGYLQTGIDPGRMGSAHPQIAPYGTVFYDQDDLPFVLAVGSDAQFARLTGLLGHPKWADDPRYATNAQRVRHRAPLESDLTACFSIWQRSELLKRLAALQIPAAPVNNLPTVADHPLVKPLLRQNENGQPVASRLVPLLWDGETLPPPLPPTEG